MRVNKIGSNAERHAQTEFYIQQIVKATLEGVEDTPGMVAHFKNNNWRVAEVSIVKWRCLAVNRNLISVVGKRKNNCLYGAPGTVAVTTKAELTPFLMNWMGYTNLKPQEGEVYFVDDFVRDYPVSKVKHAGIRSGMYVVEMAA